MRLRRASRSAGFLSLLATLVAASASGETKAPLRVGEGARTLADSSDQGPLPLEDLPQPKSRPGTADPSKGRQAAHPQIPTAVGSSSFYAQREGADTASRRERQRKELSQGPEDAQLRALRAAEKVLFPERVRGVRTSWSYDVPEPQEEGARTLGLPLTLGTDAKGEGVSAADLKWLKSLTMPDLPIQLDRRVVTYLKFIAIATVDARLLRFGPKRADATSRR